MRRALGVVAAIGLAAVIATGTAGAGNVTVKYKSHLILKERTQQMKRGTFEYRGRITSENDKCEGGRLITLYRKEAGKPEIQMSNTETDPNGKYLLIEEVNPSVKYYTRASKRSFGPDNSKVCLADKSNVTDYTP